ncbi:MAG: M14 family metallopeptidase [Anaerolineaceae bacterium]
MIFIPESYNESRAHFRARLSGLQNLWPDARLTSLPLPGSPHLSTDILTAEPLAAKDRLIVLSTGEHGIEGYPGSAVLELFFDEYARRLDPHTTGLLLIHAINPWGMEHRERNNSANVDLNRNFVTAAFSVLEDFNADYSALSPYLNPRGPLHHLAPGCLGFIVSTMKNFMVFGSRRIREAALMGQYRYPGGIYFGGLEIQPETEAIMKVYREAFAGYREIIHLDMHTGYGPHNQMTLVTSPHEKMPATQIIRPV